MSNTDPDWRQDSDEASPVLGPLTEDWGRALAVVAHPDDLEYGASAAVARWTAMGKDIRYVLTTRGEAGIDSMPPDQACPLRTAEQVAAGAAVGVSVVEFLDHPDGLVVNGLKLRRDLAAANHRHRPEVIIGSKYRDGWGTQALGTTSITGSWAGPFPTLCGMRPTAGCSPTRASRGAAYVGSPTHSHRCPLTQRT